MTIRDLYLAIDVGTGGLRAALVDRDGRIQGLAHQEHEQIVPQFGWSEQRPADWWNGTRAVVRTVLDDVRNGAARVAAICCCGQMHGTVLIDGNGRLTRETVPLWNDKRTAPQVAAFEKQADHDAAVALTANSPATAWPAFKLAWLAENDAPALEQATSVLMPKDWINYCLTGQRAQDFTEASLSFLMDWERRDWSKRLCDMTGVPHALLPDLKDPQDVLGPLLPNVAGDLGLSADIPVLVGAGDYPMALTGSGVIAAGMGSDVTGTSSIITLMRDAPVIGPEISNVLAADGTWGAMTLLDAGGDAVRWARRAFHENKRSYADVAHSATSARAGADKLFFLPYLSGERRRPELRAQFFGLTAAHGLPELHRSVLEGVGFAMRQRLDGLQGDLGRPDRIVAAGGGAKNELWLKIKASMFDVPYLVPEELECGVVGAAMLMATSTGDAADLKTAAARMVRYSSEVAPDARWTEIYDRMAPIYAKLYQQAADLHADLDALP
ncbi:xylulokinase [Litoreibacter albidus]|uniref:Xylulokinase n=1 Tax=Litoreibacter albidus TaxID=670155 RepID=A0A1H3CLH1_9RHOB|nr:FGGY family carbohydrate kinase [Litoreibacter albidus]SDX54926.1 hypothetical protein SAMN04488001_3476 [Litoreibacter albidus]